MIPTVFDITETLCSNIALTLLAASITQMLRATLIIFTAMFSVWILKMKLMRHHYLSLVVICIGLVMVGTSQIGQEQTGGNKDTDSTTMIVGILVLLFGQVFGSLSYIFEEKFLSEFEDVHPLIVVGWEGVWGSIILFFMLLAF
jgi:drug/metabolite transporter (DMT)-like permease